MRFLKDKLKLINKLSRMKVRLFYDGKGRKAKHEMHFLPPEFPAFYWLTSVSVFSSDWPLK